MRKTILLLLALLIFTVPVSAAANEPQMSGGVYLIYNASELEWISEQIYDNNIDAAKSNIRLMSSVDMSDISLRPIGTKTNPYRGSFDGNDCSLTNLKFTAEDIEGYCGLFGVLEGRVSNLDITLLTGSDSAVELNDALVAGGIAAINNGSITGCTVQGTMRFKVMEAYALLGGICGINNGTVTDCTVTSDKLYVTSASSSSDAYLKIYNDVYSGGIAAQNTGTIDNCEASGTVYARSANASSACGGICGDNSGSIKECSVKSANLTSIMVSGITSSSYAYGGGICGSNTGIIEDCYAKSTLTVRYERTTGDLSADSGGIVGYNYGTVKSCESAGTVTVYSASDEAYVNAGGFAGYNSGKILNCVSNPITVAVPANSISREIRIGGMVGNNDSGLVQSCSSKCTLVIREGTYTELKCGSLAGRIRSGAVELSSSSVTYSIVSADAEAGENIGGLVTCCTAKATAPVYAEGSGTEISPYIIKTEADLSNMRYYPDSYFELASDIVLEGSWQPIGTEGRPFSGYLNGKLHTVSGLNTGNYKYSGLFGYIKDAHISNINVTTGETGVTALFSDDSSVAYAAVLAAYAEDSIFEKCFVYGNVSITAGYAYVGGLAGRMNGSIITCASEAGLSAECLSGTGILYIGDAVGMMQGDIQNTYTSGFVAVSAEYAADAQVWAGGIAGTIRGDTQAVFSSSDIALGSSEGSIVHAGGLYGEVGGDIKSAYFAGNVSTACTADTVDAIAANPISPNITVVFYEDGKELYTHTTAQSIANADMSSYKFTSLLNTAGVEIWCRGTAYPLIIGNKLPGNYPYFRSFIYENNGNIETVINDALTDAGKSYMHTTAYYKSDGKELIAANREYLNGGYGISLYNASNKIIMPPEAELIKIFLWESDTLKPLGIHTIDAGEVSEDEAS
ncbi:MAG: hypothetical protein J6D26_06175 [Clostridia bacterium]|nr:hypothetical protein [Clostridia bacterium]